MVPITWRGRLRRVANRLLEPLGCELATAGERCWWHDRWTFDLWGRTYPQFWHHYNCGWPPYATERTVEMALADAWLERLGGDDVLEIGAVTPYYWPGRVGEIVDPHDPHRAVTRRTPMSRIDLRGRTVLSISTLEHIGTAEYGPAQGGEDAWAACARLFSDSRRFLATIPVGQNPALDRHLLEPGALPTGVRRGYLLRGASGRWSSAEAPAGSLPYGDPHRMHRYPATRAGWWANAVTILERGGLL